MYTILEDSVDLFDNIKEAKSLSNHIFEKLREDILSGVYGDGQKLIESKIAQDLGISRTPVREAIKKLELEGLVENRLNRGNIVTTIKDRDIEDIYTLRIAIEEITTRWTVERISDQQVILLEEIVDLMEFYTIKKDITKIFELNTQFHELIFKSACSGYLEHVLKDLLQIIKNQRKKSLYSDGRMDSALEEHKEILNAIKLRDSKKAVDVVIKHINSSRYI
jgi:DNA-binding GntR family transcriptional regulator